VPQGDHPRIRGEHASVAKRMSPVLGSSPHTRGARDRVLLRRLGERIIPAYAGSTYVNSTYPALAADHPRIRGEHSIVSGATCTMSGSSPHTRGAPEECVPRHSPRPDHPRIRGEHRWPSLHSSE